MAASTGKTALVTGAARGIGLAIATRLAADGLRVALLDQDRAAVEAAAAGLGVDALALVADVTRPADVDAAVARIEREWSRLDVAVNNAGITGRSFPIWELTDEDWRRVIDVDLTSVFLCCRAAVKVMLRQGGGRIVNIASRAVVPPQGGFIAYTVSKAAVITLTQALAQEVRARGITVNAVLPSTMDTPANRRAMPDADRSGWVRTEDVAAVVAFLLSARAVAVTGASLTV